MTIKTSEILIKARCIVAAGWRRLSMISRDGTQFCAAGAVGKACGMDVAHALMSEFDQLPALAVLAQAMVPEEAEISAKRLQLIFEMNKNQENPLVWQIIAFNDMSEHKVVLALFDRAIARALRVEAMADAAAAKDRGPAAWLAGDSVLANLEVANAV